MGLGGSSGFDRARISIFVAVVALVGAGLFSGMKVGEQAGDGDSNSNSERLGAGPVTTQPGIDGASTSTTAVPTTTTTMPSTTTTVHLGRNSLVREGLVASGPIEIRGQADVVIEGQWISNPNGECITIQESQRITIKNSIIGPCLGRAVAVYLAEGVTLIGSTVTESTQGFYALEASGVNVEKNTFERIGRNFVQFDKVSGGSSRIIDNWGANDAASDSAVDLVSLFQSNGTPESPIVVAGNWLQSGGLHRNGSGIMAGDGGGSYQVIEANMLINPGQVGIGVAGGTDVVVRSNQVFSDLLPNSNVGIYVWNQYDAACERHLVEANTVNWINRDGKVSGFWDGGNCGEILGIGDNEFASSITAPG